MAVAVLNPVFSRISGRIGSVVFYQRQNKQCMRTFVVPRNPDTIAQRKIRKTFANAVKSWQKLTDEEKYRYVRKARGSNMSGYNLYISQYMKYDEKPVKPEHKKMHPVPYPADSAAIQSRIHSVSASVFNPAIYLCCLFYRSHRLPRYYTANH